MKKNEWSGELLNKKLNALRLEVAGSMVDDIQLTVDATHAELNALESKVQELEEANRWIPVGERLPEEGERVLMLTGSNLMRVGYLYKGSFYNDSTSRTMSSSGYNVTHWQPLPTPPGNE